MYVNVNGYLYQVRHVNRTSIPEGGDGYFFSREVEEGPLILVYRRLRGLARLETFLHELDHAIHWELSWSGWLVPLSEAWITRAAAIRAQALVDMGFVDV